MADRKLVSIVIPVYNGADTIEELVTALASQPLGHPIEFILVNDGSLDASHEVCMKLVKSGPVPVTLIDHMRNFGEHNAVLTGLRHVNGEYIITMDDDLQNPPSEVVKLLTTLIETDVDLVYGVFIKKQHALWRNIGSKFANWVANWINDKPRGLYMSTFRAMRRFLVDAIVRYEGPYPFIDGLAYQVTNRVASVAVEHLPNRIRGSNYSLPKLVTLWTTILVNFSVKPLQLSIYLGLFMAFSGAIGALYVIVDYLVNGASVAGWASLAVLLMFFTGAQLVILGVIGEYVGRMFLAVSNKPQAIVRSKSTNRNILPLNSVDATSSGREVAKMGASDSRNYTAS
jgi:undecaprenyl-phosphate 4-deoxy-4-formamido-L-arabinose transferase